MDYFKHLLDLLKMEREADRTAYRLLTESASIAERRARGLTWYPIAIRDTEMSRGDYLTVEVERTTHTEILHQLRTGVPAALFSNHDPAADRVEGVLAWQNGNRLKITLHTDELPDWSRNGKLGIDLLFDDASYDEMQAALKQATAIHDKPREGHLLQILTGERKPGFAPALPFSVPALNASQQEALDKILSAEELAIVHGPPGTGKTTTLVQAIKALVKQQHRQLLVVAPSNAAVDLVSEKLTDEGLNVLRIGNPARVSERLTALTLDDKMARHVSMKEVKKMRKQAGEFLDMAHKYKRHFGKAEREQRKALFNEARQVLKTVEHTERYIIDDLLTKAQVITATLVGANHYSIRHLKFHTVVIDEAGQALEPACWIPVLKAQKVILAGDHCQLPPTVKSNEAARQGLGTTLLEKSVARHPEAVVLLEEQYRMNELIMGYSSGVFYENRLKAHVSVAGHRLTPDESPLAFVDTAGCGFEERTEGTSTTNPEEAAFLVKHFTLLMASLATDYATEDFPSAAIISPYKQQVEILKELFAGLPEWPAYAPKISVNTIDSFQGQERDIVYISMTRSNVENRIGFLSDIRRMNVAMTRARKKLVVIGDSATLSQLPFYAGLIAYAQEKNAYSSAWEWADL